MFRRCTIPSNTSLTRKRGERGWTCRRGVGFGLVWQRLVRWQGNGPSPRLRVRLVFSRPYVAVFKLSAIGTSRQGSHFDFSLRHTILRRIGCQIRSPEHVLVFQLPCEVEARPLSITGQLFIERC